MNRARSKKRVSSLTIAYTPTISMVTKPAPMARRVASRNPRRGQRIHWKRRPPSMGKPIKRTFKRKRIQFTQKKRANWTCQAGITVNSAPFQRNSSGFNTAAVLGGPDKYGYGFHQGSKGGRTDQAANAPAAARQ